MFSKKIDHALNNKYYCAIIKTIYFIKVFQLAKRQRRYLTKYSKLYLLLPQFTPFLGGNLFHHDSFYLKFYCPFKTYSVFFMF